MSLTVSASDAIRKVPECYGLQGIGDTAGCFGGSQIEVAKYESGTVARKGCRVLS